MNNIVTTSPNTNVIVVTSPGPAGQKGDRGLTGLAGTINSNSGLRITGSSILSGSVDGAPTLMVIGSSVITGSLTVSGSNTFINIGPANFTGSVNITGSLLIDGILSGSGANLFNIPATGITGLNLSRIATGSVSASVNVGSSAFNVSNGNTLFNVSNAGIGTFANGLIVTDGTTLINGNAFLNGSAILTAANLSTNRISDSNISASVSSTGKAFNVTNGSDSLASIDQQGAISGSGLYVSGSAVFIDGPSIRLYGNATLNDAAITTTATTTTDRIQSTTITASVATFGNALTIQSNTNRIFEVSTDGIVSGSGANLFNIPASSIVGLNLSQTATGSVAASVNIGDTPFQIVSGSSTLLSISDAGAITVSRSINIGRAKDGDYTDGLYTDVTETTTVGTMIDRFNEVLKGLSPSPAPDLDNILSSTLGGTSLLAFGALSSTESYSNVTGLSGLPAVDFRGSFAPSNNTRLGVFTLLTNISVVLNEDVPANGSPFTNYPVNAFNAPVDGGETYVLEVNGAQYTTATPTGINAVNQNGFNLTLAQTGSFPATGLPFNIFRHRTGIVTIPQGAWRNGWNYVRVTQGTNITNFIDWVYDPAAASGNFNYTFTNFVTGSVSPTGLKALSGVKYYTGFSYRVTGTIGNFYKNVYTSANRSFVGASLNIGAVSIPSPDNADSTVPVDSLHTFNGTRLLNATLASSLSINNGFGKSGTTGTITTPTILLDNVNTANTTTRERFCLENYRLPVDTYDTQVSVTSAVNTFASGSSLDTDELAVYNGALIYPSRILNSGNVLGANIVYAPADQPNYSSATGTRYFYRAFTNTTAGPLVSWSISISGTSTSFVDFNTALTTNNMRIGIKIPGTTGYRDMLAAAPASTGGSTADGIGCAVGTFIALNGSGTLTMINERLGVGEVFVLRLEVGSTWSGTISDITVTY